MERNVPLLGTRPCIHRRARPTQREGAAMIFVGAFEMRPAGDVDAQVRRLADKWWVVALFGVAVVVIGLILLFDVVTAATTLALLVAFGLFASGIDEIFEAGRHRVRWPGYLLGGLWIATGVTAVAWPDITLWALAFVVGVGFIIGGRSRPVSSSPCTACCRCGVTGSSSAPSVCWSASCASRGPRPRSWCSVCSLACGSSCAASSRWRSRSRCAACDPPSSERPSHVAQTRTGHRTTGSRFHARLCD